LLFAPPASPPIRRLQRSKSSHIIVSHWCRGEGCSPPPCAACQLAPEGACKPASQSEPLLFAPPASPPITRRLQRSKSSHIIVSHCCRGEGCSPPPCAACQLAPEGVCVSAKSERRQNGKVPVRLSEAPHSRVAFVAIWTIIRPSHSSRSCGVYGCQVCVLGAIHHSWSLANLVQLVLQHVAQALSPWRSEPVSRRSGGPPFHQYGPGVGLSCTSWYWSRCLGWPSLLPISVSDVVRCRPPTVE
jgi:hypothetical protein